MSIARYEFYDNIGSMYELCSYYDSGFIMNELCSYISYMTFIMIPIHKIVHGNAVRIATSVHTGATTIFQEPNTIWRGRPHTRHSIRSDLPQETQRTDFLMIYWRMVTLNGQTLHWYTLMIKPWSYFSKNAHGIHQICASKLGLLEFDIWTKLYHIANTICPPLCHRGWFNPKCHVTIIFQFVHPCVTLMWHLRCALKS